MSSNTHNGPQPEGFAAPQPRLLQTLEGHQGAVYDLELNAEGDLLSAGGDGLLVRWAKAGRAWEIRGKALAKAAAPLFAACSNGTGMLAGTGDGGVLSVTEDGQWKITPAHRGGTYVVTPAGTGGADGRWLNWPQGQEMAKVQGRVRCSLALDEGVLLGTSEGAIHSLSSGVSTAAHTGAVRALMAWPGKAALASVGGDGRLRIWKMEADGSLTAVLSVDAHKGAIYRMAVSPDQRWVATCSRDKSIAFWHADTLALGVRISRPHWQGHTRSINAMVWSQDGTLATAGDDGRILIWDIDLE